jgi:ornithine cyclodeaminase/alanine dehydrogenase-like protein (mu-crystallin family)
VLLVDARYGEPLAFLDGTVVTELRTAAVSAVATDTLARTDSTVLSIIGAGVQGRAHLRALRNTRTWTDIRVHSRTPARARDLVDWAVANGLPARVAASATDAVTRADVICTTTSACRPVLSAADVGPGTHVTAVGAFGATCRELPTELVVGATLFADSRAAVMAEAGDVLIPVDEGHLTEPSITEIGRVLAAEAPGRTSADEITVVKSLGLPIEDVVACELVYQRAVETGAGQDVDFG